MGNKQLLYHVFKAFEDNPDYSEQTPWILCQLRRAVSDKYITVQLNLTEEGKVLYEKLKKQCHVDVEDFFSKLTFTGLTGDKDSGVPRYKFEHPELGEMWIHLPLTRRDIINRWGSGDLDFILNDWQGPIRFQKQLLKNKKNAVRNLVENNIDRLMILTKRSVTYDLKILLTHLSKEENPNKRRLLTKIYKAASQIKKSGKSKKEVSHEDIQVSEGA